MAEPPESDLATDAVAEDPIGRTEGKSDGAIEAQPDEAVDTKPKVQAKPAKKAAGKAQASTITQDRKVFKCQPHLEVLTKLGAGFCGSVYKVKDKLDGKKYAVKEIESSGNLQQALEEVRALAGIEHKGDFGIVEYHHAWKDTTVPEDKVTEVQTLCYKMELCGKTLGWWLEKYKEQKDRNQMKMLGVFYQVVATVAYIHHKKDKEKKGFIHRDLKPDNIFVPDEGEHQIKVGDFGLAINKDTKIQGKRKGNPSPYAAPELYLDPKVCSEKVDIFSLGIILLDLLVPFASPGERITALMAAREGDFSWFQGRCRPEDLELARLLCERDPEIRPSAVQVMAGKHCKNFRKQVDGRSDALAQLALLRMEKFVCLEQDPRPDRLILLPAHLKKRFYDGIIIHHEDEEEEAKSYRDKIQALILQNGSRPLIALPGDLGHYGATEIWSVDHTLEVCSIVYLLVTEKLYKEKAMDGHFVIDMYMTASNMYPADDRKNFVIPIFTKKKADLANFLRSDVKALTGINCSRQFDAERFIWSLTDFPYAHSRHSREEDQKLQQIEYLVQKQLEELKL